MVNIRGMSLKFPKNKTFRGMLGVTWPYSLQGVLLGFLYILRLFFFLVLKHSWGGYFGILRSSTLFSILIQVRTDKYKI